MALTELYSENSIVTKCISEPESLADAEDVMHTYPIENS
jgi:hypothetical protein